MNKKEYQEYEPSEFMHALHKLLGDDNWELVGRDSYLTHKITGIQIWVDNPSGTVIISPEEYEFTNQELCFLGKRLDAVFGSLLELKRIESGRRLLSRINTLCP